ncbi:MAG: hypothetical protein GF383_12265 [Candidatus Lokiarchaeota archaeon]|nr:hypothetical protein [Candidatus Lokiarchaeota archaeon]MBD3341766.1 hypothetical protein [Candidatus Lokiarchaeota archaeon]
MEIKRYDPRKDKDALKELFENFKQNKKFYFEANWNKFEKELNKRTLNLQYRNSMLAAKEGDDLIGWITYTIFTDYLGNERVLIHQVLTKKQDSFKKGIEEALLRELQSYIKKTLNKRTVFYICPDSDGAMRSLLMKLGAKKSKFVWYENEI